MSGKSGYLGRKPDDTSVIVARQRFDLTGIQTTFTFAAGYDPGYLDAYLNGIRMLEASDYTATDGTTVSFISAPTSGDVIELVAYKAYDVVAPSSVGNFTVGGNLTVTGETTIGGGTTTTGDVGVGGSVLSDITVVGDVRVVGILTVGTSSITIDGVNNVISGVSTIGVTSVFTALPSSPPSYRNLIINGDQQVCQRYDVGVSTFSNRYITDRFEVSSDTGASVIGIASTSSGLTNFHSFLNVTNESSTSDVASYITIKQSVEGQFAVNSGWDYTNPNSNLIVSFYSRSSIGMTFYSTVITVGSDSKRFCSPELYQDADTWTRHYFMVPGNSSNTMSSDNTDQFRFLVLPHLGSNYTDSSRSANAWADGSDSQTPDYVQDLRNVAGATFDLTGVQIEVAQPGQTQPTTFEHLPFDVQLQRCQRYYYRQERTRGSARGNATGDGQCLYSTALPVTMREPPDCTEYDPGTSTSGVTFSQFINVTKEHVSALGNITTTGYWYYNYGFNADAEL